MAMFYVNNIYRLSAAFSRVLLELCDGRYSCCLIEKKADFARPGNGKIGFLFFRNRRKSYETAINPFIGI